MNTEAGNLHDRKRRRAEQKHASYMRCVHLHFCAAFFIFQFFARNRAKNIGYAKAWNSIHRGRGHMRKVKKTDRPVGLGHGPPPMSDPAPVGPPPTKLRLDKKLDPRWAASGYPSDWSEKDIEFWRSQ